ncbi:MAG: AAA family ATPase [Weissella confusa]
MTIELPFDENRFRAFCKGMGESVQIPNKAVSNEIAKWLVEGIAFHDMQNKNQTCQFCGNTFNGEKISRIIDEKTNSAHAKLVKALEKMRADILSFNDILEKLPFTDLTTELLVVNQNMINAIGQKIEDTTQKISIEGDYWNLLSQLESRIQEDKESQNQILREIENQLARIELVAKSWIGQSLKKDQSVESLVSTIETTQSQIESLVLAHKDNLAWIEETRRQESDLKVFMKIANSELMKAGFGFELRIDTDYSNYTVWHSMDNIQLSLSQLSEGERRFIAFIHFYYNLFKEPGKKIADGVTMVIIDDPITSLDSDNRFYLTELINGFIKFAVNADVQVFVLTHSSQDFHNFAYGAGRAVKWFRIVKDEQGLSSVEPVSQEEKNNYSDYYRTTFESLVSFAQLSNRKLNESYLSYGNKARVIFESHAKSHYKLNYATNAAYDDIKKFYEIPDEFDADVQRMLDVINSLSHGLTIIDDLEISPKELQTNIRTLLHLLWLKDEQHVLQMAGNKINKENHNDTMKWLS